MDELGDFLKGFERIETEQRAQREMPLMARLDGRAFHTFTHGLKRPYDLRLSQLMCDTTKFLVKETHAKVGYTQSDEITLCWNLDLQQNPNAAYMFDGKFQKLTSVLAGLASGFFCRELASRIPEKANTIATFDARVWNVPTMYNVFQNYVWRQDDAVKNSISMAAQAKFSHMELHGVNSENKKAMLRTVGSPWEDEPEFFKYGQFVKRRCQYMSLSESELAKIPPAHRPTAPVLRSSIQAIDVGYIRGRADALELLFAP